MLQHARFVFPEVLTSKCCWQGPPHGSHNNHENIDGPDNTQKCAAEALLVKTISKHSREDKLDAVPRNTNLCLTLTGYNETFSICLCVTQWRPTEHTFVLLVAAATFKGDSLVNLALHDTLPIVSAACCAHVNNAAITAASRHPARQLKHLQAVNVTSESQTATPSEV